MRRKSKVSCPVCDAETVRRSGFDPCDGVVFSIYELCRTCGYAYTSSMGLVIELIGFSYLQRDQIIDDRRSLPDTRLDAMLHRFRILTEARAVWRDGGFAAVRETCENLPYERSIRLVLAWATKNKAKYPLTHAAVLAKVEDMDASRKT